MSNNYNRLDKLRLSDYPHSRVDRAVTLLHQRASIDQRKERYSATYLDGGTIVVCLRGAPRWGIEIVIRMEIYRPKAEDSKEISLFRLNFFRYDEKVRREESGKVSIVGIVRGILLINTTTKDGLRSSLWVDCYKHGYFGSSKDESGNVILDSLRLSYKYGLNIDDYADLVEPFFVTEGTTIHGETPTEIDNFYKKSLNPLR